MQLLRSVIAPTSPSSESIDAFLREHMGDAVVYTDESLRITHWNKTAEEMYGWSAPEVTGRKITDMLVSQEILTRARKQQGQCLFEESRYTHTGYTVNVQMTVSIVPGDAGEMAGLLCVAKDITERKKLESEKQQLASQLKQEIGKKNREIRDVFDRVSDGVLLLDKKWACLYVNTRLADMLGLGPIEMIGKQFLDIFPNAGDMLGYHEYAEVMSGRSAKLLESYYEPADLWYETSINPFSEGLAVFVRDISEKKKAERNSSRKSRLYHFSSQIGQMILRSPDRESLLKGVCDIAVTVGEFTMAWVGMVDDASLDVIPVVCSGDGGDHLLNLQVSCNEALPEGRGTIGTCIREKKYAVSNHIVLDPSMQPWKAEAARWGYQSCISLPVILFDQVVGALTLCAAARNYFDVEEIALLQATVCDICFALEQLENEGKRKDVEREIAQYKFALDKFAMIAIFNQDGIMQRVNEHLCRVVQYNSEELVGQDFRMISNSSQFAALSRVMKQHLLAGRIWKGEVGGKAKDGTGFWVEGTLVPFMNEKGKAYQYLAILYDITERKKVESDLKEHKEVYDHVARATSDFIRDWDLEGNSIRFNMGLYEMLGYTEAAFNNSPDFGYTCMHPDDLPGFLETIRDVFDRKLRNFHAEYRFRCADGKYKYLYERAFLIYDTNEKPVRIVAAIQDITWQKNETMRLAKATLDAQENERTMLGRELHDNINQILVGSLINLQMSEQLGAAKGQPLVHKSIGYIKNAIDELRKLSHRLAPTSFHDLGLREIFENLLETFTANQQVQMHLDIADLPKGSLDSETETHLYRICQEQMSNIFKYAKASEVWLSVLFTEESLRMRIADNGVGFDPKQSAKGIGLNNIRNRVSIMLGSLSIQTAPGQGCELLIDIPMLKCT